MTEKQDIQAAKIEKDIEYIKESLNRNFEDHAEIKAMFEKRTVSRSRFMPVETITYGLAGGTLMWALSQVLATVKAIF